MAIIRSGVDPDELKVDSHGSAQTVLYGADGLPLAGLPVSIAQAPLPAGAATEASLVALLVELGQKLEPGGQVGLDPAALAALETTELGAATLAALETIGLDAPTLAALETTELGAATLAALETIELGAATLAALEQVTVSPTPAGLAVTATGLTGAAVTATLPAVAGQTHHLTALEVTAYSTAARVGAAVPVLVTTSNLPGSPALTFASAAPIGTADRYLLVLDTPLRAAAANTAATIVCPATVGIIWRVNVHYYTAP